MRSQEISVRLEHPPGTKICCPDCLKEPSCYDHGEESHLRQLDIPFAFPNASGQISYRSMGRASHPFHNPVGTLCHRCPADDSNRQGGNVDPEAQMGCHLTQHRTFCGENVIDPFAGILKISRQFSDRYPFTISADQTEIHSSLDQNIFDFILKLESFKFCWLSYD